MEQLWILATSRHVFSSEIAQPGTTTQKAWKESLCTFTGAQKTLQFRNGWMTIRSIPSRREAWTTKLISSMISFTYCPTTCKLTISTTLQHHAPSSFLLRPFHRIAGSIIHLRFYRISSKMRWPRTRTSKPRTRNTKLMAHSGPLIKRHLISMVLENSLSKAFSMCPMSASMNLVDSTSISTAAISQLRFTTINLFDRLGTSNTPHLARWLSYSLKTATRTLSSCPIAGMGRTPQIAITLRSRQLVKWSKVCSTATCSKTALIHP